MRDQPEREFYIIANYPEPDVGKPVFLYADGSAELEPWGEFKSRFFKQYYDVIQRYMELLENHERDLRKDFHRRREPLALIEVLEQIRNKENISISELWQFFYKEQVEFSIHTTLRLLSKSVGQARRRALRQRAQDIEARPKR